MKIETVIASPVRPTANLRGERSEAISIAMDEIAALGCASLAMTYREI